MNVNVVRVQEEGTQSRACVLRLSEPKSCQQELSKRLFSHVATEATQLEYDCSLGM